MRVAAVAALTVVLALETEALAAAVAAQVDQPHLELEEAQAEPMAQLAALVVMAAQTAAVVAVAARLRHHDRLAAQAVPAS